VMIAPTVKRARSIPIADNRELIFISATVGPPV